MRISSILLPCMSEVTSNFIASSNFRPTISAFQSGGGLIKIAFSKALPTITRAMSRVGGAMRPEALHEGTSRSGDRAAKGMPRPRLCTRRLHPATGSHLPSEDTAPPCAVALRLLHPTSYRQKIYSAKNSRTLSIQDFARGLWRESSWFIDSSSSCNNSLWRAVSLTGVSTMT
jgi:hypothetical protein